MPRLSLYRPQMGNDYNFMDRVILEQFMVGGTDIYIHKYLGPAAPDAANQSPSTPMNTNPIGELGIQDILLLENRDRTYDTNIYVTRCIYNLGQLDFSLSQFGLFLAGDTIFINMHLNDHVKVLGRKILAGDVIELPHLKDPYALNDAQTALRRFYVVDEVSRPTEGFSQTWYPHLVKIKAKPLVDSQEFKQILDLPAADPASPYADESGSNSTLRDIMTMYNKNMEINNAIIAQAEADAPLSGYDTEHLWMVPVDANGKVMLEDASQDVSSIMEDVSSLNLDASILLKSPKQNYYVGYMSGDGIPPNGFPKKGGQFGMGPAFPEEKAFDGQFFLRTDFIPNRLFRFDGYKWQAYEDNVRMTMTNNNTRQTQKTSFINNTNVNRFGDKIIEERQSLTQLKDIAKKLRPDN
jgi:hypothetical protein